MRFEIKEITAEGTFEGILSPYGNVDNGGDVVLPGAYAKTLKEQGDTRPLLWQHKSDQPIGLLTLEDRPEGLWAKGELLMELPDAKKAYLLIKARIVKGLSIGFVAMKDAVNNGIRQLSEVKLYEGSIVTFPMNESALITSVKSANRETKGDFNEELTDIQLQDAAYQMRCALSCALSSLVWSGLSKEEIVSASDTVIQQFRDAYMTYIPQYIDMLTEMYGEMKTWNEKRLETKSGRKISAATKEKLASAHEQMKSAVDTISALLADEADEPITTSDTKAAAIPAAHEPTDSHSEALASLRALIPK
jgi:HK97 family phage prohead protease